jgi:hypothetical protein
MLKPPFWRILVAGLILACLAPWTPSAVAQSSDRQARLAQIDAQIRQVLAQLAQDLARVHAYLVYYDQTNRMAVLAGTMTAADADNRLRQAGNALYYRDYADSEFQQLVTTHRAAAEQLLQGIWQRAAASQTWPNGGTAQQWVPYAQDQLRKIGQDYAQRFSSSQDTLPDLDAAMTVLAWTEGYQSQPANFSPFAGQEQRIVASIPNAHVQQVLTQGISAQPGAVAPAAAPAAAAPAAAAPATAAPTSSYVENPTMSGVAVDICLTWATDCGQPAADAYCRAAGYAVASNFTPRPHAQQTYVIGSGQICNGDFCTAFGSVTCQAQR